MNQEFRLVAPNIVPVLDPEFRPPVLANRAFLKEVDESGCAVPCLIAVERDRGRVSRFDTRVFDMHMKDVTGNTKANHSVEVGRGVIDFAQYVRIMRKVKYTGSVSLEYEKDMKTPFNGIAESVGYFRGICAATR